MNKQPEALKLAEKLEGYSPNSGYATYCHKAAVELRRLHEVNGELLEALKSYSLPIDMNNIALSRHEFGSQDVERELKRRAAIAKAEGEQA
jgi:hypothetical protein